MPDPPRIVITGVGVVTPLGHRLDELWSRAGRRIGCASRDDFVRADFRHTGLPGRRRCGRRRLRPHLACSPRVAGGVGSACLAYRVDVALRGEQRVRTRGLARR
jgi:hypothetical protein